MAEYGKFPGYRYYIVDCGYCSYLYMEGKKKAEPNVSAVRQQEGVPGKTGTPDVNCKCHSAEK